jgi:hypothetical protein
MSSTLGVTRPRGALALEKHSTHEPTLRAILWHGLPRPGISPAVALWRTRNVPNLLRGLWRVSLAKLIGVPVHYGVLQLSKIENGQRVELGFASVRVVTDAGVNFLRDNLRGSIATISNMKFHGFGTGTNAEATGDTALQTELTTQYATDNTRPTGSQASNGTGDYRTVATLSPDSGGTIAITEHGIFDQAANSGGTLLDRSKFSAVNLVAGSDSLQATYDFVCTSGG